MVAKTDDEVSVLRPSQQPTEVRSLSGLFLLQSTDDFQEGREHLPSFSTGAAS